MGKKSKQIESSLDKEEGGVKLDALADDAMDVDSAPAPTGDLKKSAADARAERAARRKQRREELASEGHSATSSLASTPSPETEPVTIAKSEEKPKKGKLDRKSTLEKSERAEIETEAPAATPESSAAAAAVAATTEPLPFVIDVKPSKPAVAKDDTDSQSASERGVPVVPGTVNGSEGPNRAARRRLMQIEKHRAMIKKDLGIPAESDERQDEVDNLLAAWTARFDEKAEARAAKKIAKKQDKGKGKGKVKGKLQGRNSNDKEKQIKKQRQKNALRARQEAGSGPN